MFGCLNIHRPPVCRGFYFMSRPTYLAPIHRRRALSVFLLSVVTRAVLFLRLFFFPLECCFLPILVVSQAPLASARAYLALSDLACSSLSPTGFCLCVPTHLCEPFVAPPLLNCVRCHGVGASLFDAQKTCLLARKKCLSEVSLPVPLHAFPMIYFPLFLLVLDGIPPVSVDL